MGSLEAKPALTQKEDSNNHALLMSILGRLHQLFYKVVDAHVDNYSDYDALMRFLKLIKIKTGGFLYSIDGVKIVKLEKLESNIAHITDLNKLTKKLVIKGPDDNEDIFLPDKYYTEKMIKEHLNIRPGSYVIARGSREEDNDDTDERSWKNAWRLAVVVAFVAEDDATFYDASAVDGAEVWTNGTKFDEWMPDKFPYKFKEGINEIPEDGGFSAMFLSVTIIVD